MVGMNRRSFRVWESSTLLSHFVCFLFVMFAQVPNLLAMLDLSGDRKKEACDKLDRYDPRLGPGGLAQLVECGGDFPAAFRNAKTFCGAFNALNPPDESEKMCNIHACNIVKAQVRLCMCANMVCGHAG